MGGDKKQICDLYQLKTYMLAWNHLHMSIRTCTQDATPRLHKVPCAMHHFFRKINGIVHTPSGVLNCLPSAAAASCCPEVQGPTDLQAPMLMGFLELGQGQCQDMGLSAEDSRTALV